jgi:hypothetical protein
MEATQTANPPSFETVWAILDRVSKKQEELVESQKETDRKMQETDRKMQESDRKMQESAARLDKQLGKLGIRMGEIVEYMVAPNLREKFRELGYDFPQANPNSDVSDRTNNIFLEIDVKLENGDKAMLVEVKTKPTTEDVQDHIKRLEKMRVYADLHGDKRKFLGAVAGVVMSDNVKEYILKQGFFVIEPSGETFNIIPPNNKPKEW